jgi:hypothetical protein
MDAGMRMDRSDEQSANARIERIESVGSDSKVKCDKASQPWKQSAGIATIDAGIQIDRSDEQRENAEDPTIDIAESRSNVNC